MSPTLHPVLPKSEQFLLRVGALLVPPADRADWTRTWQAELWHLHARPSLQRRATGPLLPGLIKDAVWLRTESCRRALEGTALLCLLQLASACLAAFVAGRFLTQGPGVPAGAPFAAHIPFFLVEAPLILFVTFATTSRRHLRSRPASNLAQSLRRQMFFLGKGALVLAFSFLASVDLTWLPRATFPLAADILQTLCCVVFALTGLRWVILDQQQRCKQCLLALASPSHVGRPSHNLLEWNGTHQLCRKGHGALSSPELETSWCSHSQWIEHPHNPHLQDHHLLA